MLTGLMGSGKSTVGRMLSEQVSVPFIDTDREIERLEGRTIREVFAEDGEGVFRARERDVVRESLREAGGRVIALGGGAFVDPACRDACRSRGAITVYLRSSPEAIVARLNAEEVATRPLLGEDSLERLRELLSVREPTYSLAQLAIDTDGRSAEQVVSEILVRLDD